MVAAVNVSSAGAPTSRQGVTAALIRQWLTQVSDPEIPVLSIVDLGLVRDVAFEDQTCVVTITPTYSGCPAMLVIEGDIRKALRGHGVESLRVDTRLSPAWTTDWLTPKGRAALKNYGIAPPQGSAASVCGLARRRPTVAILCPQCGSRNTTPISEFGSTPCKALYRCHACGEPFDYFKPH